MKRIRFDEQLLAVREVNPGKPGIEIKDITPDD